MKKHGILNAKLNAELSRLGHTDLVIIADCGLPIPRGVRVVDLAVVHGVPRFEQVLDAVLGDVEFERALAATEAGGTVVETWLGSRFSTVDHVGHAEFKELTASAALVIRTGEATPYANVALWCGVSF